MGQDGTDQRTEVRVKYRMGQNKEVQVRYRTGWDGMGQWYWHHSDTKWHCWNYILVSERCQMLCSIPPCPVPHLYLIILSHLVPHLYLTILSHPILYLTLPLSYPTLSHSYLTLVSLLSHLYLIILSFTFTSFFCPLPSCVPHFYLILTAKHLIAKCEIKNVTQAVNCGFKMQQ